MSLVNPFCFDGFDVPTKTQHDRFLPWNDYEKPINRIGGNKMDRPTTRVSSRRLKRFM